MPKSRIKNTGKEFESLLTWINQCLHQSAVIIPNDKLRDRHSGKLRQIDISIRLTDGPTEFLGIIEVRNRSRPVGVDYIEQMQTKKQAVGADAAFIVSNKGFYKSAIKKADALGIRLFSFNEALRENWSLFFKKIQFITRRITHSRNPVLTILEQDTHKIIDPHDDILKTIKKGNIDELVIVDEHHKPAKSFNDLYTTAVNVNALQTQLKVGEENAQKFHVIVYIKDNKKYFIRDRENNYREIKCLSLLGEFWIEEQKQKVKVSQYTDPLNENIRAELLSLQNPKDLDIELLAKNPTDTTQGHQIFVRTKKL